jgi:hypothetical protein
MIQPPGSGSRPDNEQYSKAEREIEKRLATARDKRKRPGAFRSRPSVSLNYPNYL